MNDIKTKIDFLISEIEKNNRLYYDEDAPIISDFEYDKLMKELISLEEKYPEYKLDDSPTNYISGNIKEGFKKVNHKIKLLSLANAFNEEDLISFDEKIKKLNIKREYALENKFDGLTIVLTYEKGKLVGAATRGDGEVGEDVTNNVLSIKSIKKTLSEEVSMIIRGEVFIDKENFEVLNAERELSGLPTFANPRNMAAGTMRQLDSNIVKKRNLDCFIFNLEQIENKKFKTHAQSIEYLKNLGFKTSEYIISDDIKEVYKICKEKEENKDSYPFLVDGVVIKINNILDRDILGQTSKVPRWAIAYKFSEEKVITTIKDIIVQVGRMGNVTPVAILEGVNVSGSFVERATLHNEDYINDNDIRIGDKVYVIKAGEIIPRVLASIKDVRDGSEQIFHMPKNCPVCGWGLVRIDGQSILKCLNPNCPAKISRAIIHFASREAMNIEGLGEKNLEKFIDLELVNDISDIYLLKDKKDKLVLLDKMGDKMVANILKAIEKSKENSLENLIFGLSINLIGKQNAKTLASKFKNIDNLINAKYEDLVIINEVGDKMANEIIAYFNDEKNLQLINKLKQYGLNINYIDTQSSNLKFDNLTFVLTGTLQKYKRSEAKKIIEDFGGSVSSSVSKNTDFVFTGENAGSKAEKAKNLGVKIIDEDEFDRMIK